jgi:hypothetical protein
MIVCEAKANSRKARIGGTRQKLKRDGTLVNQKVWKGVGRE